MKSSSTTRKQYSDHAVFCLDEVGVEERKLYSTKFYDRKISFDVMAKRYIQIYLFIVHKYMMYMLPFVLELMCFNVIWLNLRRVVLR